MATAGALFLGEVMGKTPCVLCWYQRIAMFPLVLVLGMGLLRRTRAARATHCRWPGWDGVLPLYHLLVFWGVVSEGLVPCGKGSSCADADVQVAGLVPIPLLSLAAFTAILVLLWVARGRGQNMNRKWIVLATVAAVVVAFAAGVVVFTSRSTRK